MYDTADDEEEEEVEGFTDFLQEMVSLMNDARNEEKNYYSMEEPCFGRWPNISRHLPSGIIIIHRSNTHTSLSGTAPALSINLEKCRNSSILMGSEHDSVEFACLKQKQASE